MMAAPIDHNIQSISLHKNVPILWHFYVFPFVLIYATWLYLWTIVYGIDEYWELGLIALAVIGIIHILVCLSCYWSVHIRAKLTTRKVSYYHYAFL